MKVKYWTCAEEKRLMEAYLNGKSTREIADIINRPQRSVDRRIYRMVKSGRLEKQISRRGKDLSGRKFGERTVIKRDPKKADHWIMQCSCGKLSSIEMSKIGKGECLRCRPCAARYTAKVKNKTNLRFGNKPIDRTNERFGYWVVLDGYEPIPDNSGTLRWVMKCECGTERWKLPTNLRRKKIVPANCGCKRGQAPCRNELALIPGERVRTVFKGLS